MATFRLLALAVPPTPTPHTVRSLLKGQGLASNLAVLRTPHALKSAYTRGAECCGTVKTYGVAQQYHRAASSVNWL